MEIPKNSQRKNQHDLILIIVFHHTLTILFLDNGQLESASKNIVHITL